MALKFQAISPACMCIIMFHSIIRHSMTFLKQHWWLSQYFSLDLLAQTLYLNCKSAFAQYNSNLWEELLQQLFHFRYHDDSHTMFIQTVFEKTFLWLVIRFLTFKTTHLKNFRNLYNDFILNKISEIYDDIIKIVIVVETLLKENKLLFL